MAGAALSRGERERERKREKEREREMRERGADSQRRRTTSNPYGGVFLIYIMVKYPCIN